MNANDSERLEEHLVSMLAARDEALATGMPSTPLPGVAEDSELRLRLEGNLACLQRLHRLRPRHSAALAPPDTPFGLAPTDQTGPDAALKTIGRFQIRRELGRGGFGVVFLAHDPVLGREVALKVPRADALVSPELRARFQQEARAAAILDHPNLVPVFEAGEIGPICYIASAYCSGITLAHWLKEQDEGVPDHQAAALVATLAEAVQHAHSRGILHRDLKPANVLLQKEEGRSMTDESVDSSVMLLPSSFTPKITDFGLAKLLETEPGMSAAEYATASGTFVGTPNYMAPEQAVGKPKEITTAVDIYGLGAVLYELLTGRPPFQAETMLETLDLVRTHEPMPPRRLRPQLARDVETICLKCLDKVPGKRYASAHALAEDLRRFLAGEPIQARPTGSAERLARWCRRNPALATASSLAVVGLLALVAVSVGYGIDRSDAADRLRVAAADLSRKNDETEAALKQAKRQTALVALERGLSLCDQGDAGRGLLWLARSLADAPEDDADLQRYLRISWSAWRREVRPLRAVLPHSNPVGSLAWSPDGKTFVTTNGADVQLWDGTTLKPIGHPLRHEGAIWQVVFSPDSKSIWTGCSNQTAQRWDAASGQPLGAPLRHGAWVTVIAISPDGKYLLTGSDRTAQLWEVATGMPSGPPLKHQGQVHRVAFSPDGRTAVTTSADATARLWDVATGQPVGDPLQHQGAVNTVAFHPAGKTVLTGSDDNTARQWDAATGKLIGPGLQHLGAVYAVAFSPDGKAMLTGSNDGTAQLWDASTGRPRGNRLRHEGRVTVVAFSPNGDIVLTGSADHTVRLWNAGTGRPLGSPLRHDDEVRAAAFGPDGRTVLTGSWDKTARQWDIVSGRPQIIPSAHSGPLQKSAFSPDGRVLGTVSRGGNDIQLWDLVGDRLIGRLGRHQHPVFGVAFSPVADAVLVGDEQGTVQLWEMSTGKPCGAVVRQPGAAWALAFSPDGKRFATASSDKSVRLWETDTGRSFGRPLNHDNAVAAVTFSPDGRTVLTGSHDNTARLWDAATGEPIGRPLPHQAVVRAVAFSPDGKAVLTGSADKAVRLWNPATATLLVPPMHHPGIIEAVSFSPGGETILACGWDATARLWETATGRPIGPPLWQSPAFQLMGAAYNPDGRTIRTVRGDGTLFIWKAPVAIGGDPERIRLCTEMLTGMELDKAQVIRLLDAETWRERRRCLQDLGDPSAPDAVSDGNISRQINNASK